MRNADVLIAGAGPAGALAALLLARRGLRVRVFDRAMFPRDKLCGDTLNPGALEILRRLGLAEDVDAMALRIRGMIVTGARGVRVVGEYGRGVYGLAVPRRDLDAMLVARAAAAGAGIETGVVVRAPLVEDVRGHPRVVGLRIGTGLGEHEVRAPLTIAADGRRSRIAFGLGLTRHPEHPRRWAIGAHFEGVEGSGDVGEMHIRPGCYIGVAPLPSGLTNACVVVADPRSGSMAEPGELLLRTLGRDPMLGERFATARFVTAPIVVGPLAVDNVAPGMAGLLMAGDASGFIDPMTGDGMRFAFRGAELAADLAERAIGDPSFDAARALATVRMREFGGKWRMNRALRAIVMSPRAVLWAARGARLCPPLVRQIISAAGDVP